MAGKIEKRAVSDLSLLSLIDFDYDTHTGSSPNGIVTDGISVYVADRSLDKIVKFQASDLSYVSSIGSTGSGVNQFNQPRYLAIIDTASPVVARPNSFANIIW
jgi:6-phosphogluconolactonase (cycloisomerase 2 family)